MQDFAGWIFGQIFNNAPFQGCIVVLVWLLDVSHGKHFVVGKKWAKSLSNPRMTERALELLLLPDRPCLLLDIGCGSGISAPVYN